MLAKDRAVWNRVQKMARLAKAVDANASSTPAHEKAIPGVTSSSTLEALRDVRILHGIVEDWQLDIIKGARSAGVSWAEIASALGMSRQAAWERWHELA